MRPTYATSRFLHAPELLDALDQASSIRHNAALLTPVNFEQLSREQVEDRVSLETLMGVRKNGDKFRGLEDTVKYKLQMSDGLREHLAETATEAFRNAGFIEPADELTLSGNGYYPENTYMGWHTNSCTPGVRIYCNWASDSGKSGLHYWYDGISSSRRTMIDDAGWSFRFFSTDGPELFWHSVYSFCDRISIGFRVLKGKE